MPESYYQFKTKSFSCKPCGWNGLGAEMKQGELLEGGYEVCCPACSEVLAFVDFPTYEDVFKYGTPQDQAALKAQLGKRQEMEATLLKDISQLPDLFGDNMAFVLTETDYKDDQPQSIAISYNGQVIWKEACFYEYYERFIELGMLLKQKYGAKMIDLVPDVPGIYLYGDALSSFRKIEEFRKTLA